MFQISKAMGKNFCQHYEEAYMIYSIEIFLRSYYNYLTIMYIEIKVLTVYRACKGNTRKPSHRHYT